jgi:CRISPR system Cascade subunit CasA
VPNDPQRWRRLFLEPPSPEELQAAWAPFDSAFVMDGDGPRFLQDFEPLDAEASPVEALLVEAPGANTAKLNKDRRGRC